MITDQMLKNAAEEANQILLGALLPEEQCPHSFSEYFCNKMKKLIFRVNHPMFLRIVHMIARVMIAFVIGGGFVLTFDAEARTLLAGWAQKTSGVLTRYFFVGEIEEKRDRRRYCLSEIPEGYEIFEIYSLENGEMFVYVNEQEELLTFSYFDHSDGTELYLETENYRQIIVPVGEVMGELYLADRADAGNALVWEIEGTLFYLDGFFDEEDLVDLAENIEINGQDK